MPDGNSVIIFCDGTDVNLKIVNSKTGSLVSNVNTINSPYEFGSSTINPTFNAYNNRNFSEEIDVKAVGNDKFVQFGVEMIPVT